MSWKALDFNALPPFSVILRVLQKVMRDRESGVIIVPTWPTQVWWLLLKMLLTREPVTLLSTTSLFRPSHPGKTHNLLKLHFLA